MEDSPRGKVIQNETAHADGDSTVVGDGVCLATSPVVISAEWLETLLTQPRPGTDCTFVIKTADGSRKVNNI
jgi:hypothetical protein